jgi:hypothetical protein
MKIKQKQTHWGKKIEFKGKFVRGAIHEGGSGFLEVVSKEFVPCGDYLVEHGTHAMRVRDIKRLAKLYTSAARELSKIKY